MFPCHVDYSQFRGFAFRNETGKDLALVINNESAYKKEFILRPMEVYYAYVADLIAVLPLKWAKQSGFQYLYGKKEVS